MLTRTSVHKRPAGHPSDHLRGPALAFVTHEFDSLIERMGTTMLFRRGSEIYGDKEPADYFYKLGRGAVRTYKILNDGRRQIGSFYLPNDIFGFENGTDHTLSADAITEAEVLVIKRTSLWALAEQNQAVARRLWLLTSHELDRMQDHVLLLVKNAHERVAEFMLEMADRLNANREFDLPMSRQDVADYLGLTIETISRVLTHLENSAIIALPTIRRVVIKDRDALIRLIS